MEYRDRIVQTQRQKTRLSFSIDENLVQNVQENLNMIGLDQSNFLVGFLTNVANNKKLPFEKLSKDEEKKAVLAAELNSLSPSWDDTPELKNSKEFEEWLNEG